jgi:hypothetical protein
MSNEQIENAYRSSSNVDEMTLEEKETYLISIGLGSPKITPDLYEFFAFVVEDKVSVIFIANKEYMPDYINAFSSNPTIVKLSNEQKNVVEMNWNYDSQTGQFSQP